MVLVHYTFEVTSKFTEYPFEQTADGHCLYTEQHHNDVIKAKTDHKKYVSKQINKEARIYWLLVNMNGANQLGISKMKAVKKWGLN